MTRAEMEDLWAEHLKAEFTTKDVHAALRTMVQDASSDHVPVHTGGKGVGELLSFYCDNFTPSWPVQTSRSDRGCGLFHDRSLDAQGAEEVSGILLHRSVESKGGDRRRGKSLAPIAPERSIAVSA